MASMHEMQKTDTPRVDTLRHDKPQTLGAQMQHVGTQVKETMQDVGTQVKETMQAAGTQVKETVQHVGTQVKETMQDVGTQVKETMQAAGSQVYEQGRESLQDLNRTIEAQIRERPIQALLVAGGIGVLLGLLWRRS
jgi:ElaB/YqjD/DUF883 family membrane-anchored ribosome-binding protein